MLQLKVIATADVPAVLALQAQCYGPDFLESAAAFEAKLSAARHLHCSYLAVDGDQPLAYVVSLPVDDDQLPALDAPTVAPARAPRTLYLHDLAVSPAGRARQLGQKLVRQVVQRAQDMGLAQVALIAVQGSQGYWERHGFAVAEVAEGSAMAGKLASFGSGATLMRRALGPV
ncbi:MAG: GNAT family N-acetyltransferase [Mitsuaria chitosanitabida]|jgi:ribosomal protein S18 acetylase RimI-like enzyme|uniref:GNAT family N-acetyltransferase n=1 Tax=Roseateles chitosanitabidus TaxID=65048 RepID=UPI001B17A5D8|nr:GNAT family N-acetyltransferase [Roseateles chitosanitabidus]MBO9686253.1 GNAT family N-acetyltransferase [Roseateles chitosanitabidus]